MPYRRERAQSFVLQELTILLRNHTKDPRVTPLSITEVEFTQDRRLVRVYVTCFSGDDDELNEGLAGLESAKGFIRRHLSKVLHWHFTPHVEFRPDRSWQYGQHIDSLLDNVHEQDQERIRLYGEPEPDEDDPSDVNE